MSTWKVLQSVEHYSQIMPLLGYVMEAVALLVCAPLAEEVICRGIMITRLQRSFSDVKSLFKGKKRLFGCAYKEQWAHPIKDCCQEKVKEVTRHAIKKNRIYFKRKSCYRQ